MNKKVLFLVLLTIAFILPLITLAQAGSAGCTVLKSIQGAFTTIGITLVVISWLVAGFMYLTALGSTERMGTAKKAVTAAIIGTVLVSLAYAMLPAIWSLLGGAAGSMPAGC